MAVATAVAVAVAVAVAAAVAAGFHPRHNKRHKIFIDKRKCLRTRIEDGKLLRRSKRSWKIRRRKEGKPFSLTGNK